MLILGLHLTTNRIYFVVVNIAWMKRKKSESVSSSMEPSPEPKRSLFSGYLTRGRGRERDRRKQAQEKESRSSDSKMPEMGRSKQMEKQEHAQEGKTQVCGIFSWATLSFPVC